MKKVLKISILLFICLGILFVGTEVMAATASITVNPESVTVGDTVTATVKYTAAAWNLKVTADSGLTTSSTTQYADSTDSAENESKSFTVKYTTSKAGDLYIYLNGDITDETANKADVVSQKVKVTIKEKPTTTDKKDDENKTTTTDKETATDKKEEVTIDKPTTDKTTDKETTTDKKEETITTKPKEKSSNAYLSTLGVTPKEYDFSDFSKTKYTYNVTVPSDVDSLKVLYKTADSNAKVKVSGNSGFETGSDNKITIKVTAEDGKTAKTYTIKVTKLAEDKEKPGNVIENEEELYLTSLDVEGVDLSPKFAKYTYSYTATLSDSNVNELDIDAVANSDKANIEISGNKDLVEGENTINVLLTQEDSSEQTVYQIVVTKEAGIIPATTNSENSSNFNILEMMKGYIGIAIIVVIVMVIVLILLIKALRKENKRIREDEDEEEFVDSNTAEYNVFKNDINEFENNNLEKDNFIESLYKQRNGDLEEEGLEKTEIETLEEIRKQTEKIFEEKNIQGQSVEYSPSEFMNENPLEERRKRRGKGKHF